VCLLLPVTIIRKTTGAVMHHNITPTIVRKVVVCVVHHHMTSIIIGIKTTHLKIIYFSPTLNLTDNSPNLTCWIFTSSVISG
jgi:hypothetical protein